MRLFLTGGSGKAGRHVAPYLAGRGHQVTNADLVPLGHPDVADLRVDLTDAGQTWSALAGLATMAELDLPQPPAYDAVVHLAAVPRTRPATCSAGSRGTRGGRCCATPATARESSLGSDGGGGA